MGFWSVWAVGVGGMVGGIFPVLGLAVQLTHGGAPLAFLLAGMIALMTTYSYVQLSLTYPNKGGTVTFFQHAFGNGLLSGTLNLLLWLSYLIMLSLYCSAVGSYGVSLWTHTAQPLWQHGLISAAVLGTTSINLLSAKAVGQAQRAIVGFKLAILLLFIAVGLGHMHWHQLAPATWLPLPNLLTGAMVIFLAYEGFELIANTADDVVDPRHTLPRVYYAAVLFVVSLYVLVTVVTVGTSSITDIVAARDAALAQAARPLLGPLGVLLMTAAAMLSALSANNATLYASARFSATIAHGRRLTARLPTASAARSLPGLLLTSSLTLLLANLFDLARIATMGSAGFLLIFAAVNGTNARLAQTTRSRQWLSLLGVLLCLSALGVLIWQTFQTDAVTLWVLVVLVGLAIGLEGLFFLFRLRRRTF
ncbi:MAG: APC family permease [Lyngbya sp. HA4199-MV5]|nr:APC family permease [Lyngbya sp. HA4199-MV5]